MKTCTKCEVEKELSEFSPKGTGLHSHCKLCRRKAYQKVYSSSEKEKERLRKKAVDNRAAARAVSIKAKSVPCTDCSETYPYYVMQFDHLGDDKAYNVAWMVSHNYTVKKIKEEIAKCEVVCANCHAERTHRRRLDSQAVPGVSLEL